MLGTVNLLPLCSVGTLTFLENFFLVFFSFFLPFPLSSPRFYHFNFFHFFLKDLSHTQRQELAQNTFAR